VSSCVPIPPCMLSPMDNLRLSSPVQTESELMAAYVAKISLSDLGALLRALRTVDRFIDPPVVVGRGFVAFIHSDPALITAADDTRPGWAAGPSDFWTSDMIRAVERRCADLFLATLDSRKT